MLESGRRASCNGFLLVPVSWMAQDCCVVFRRVRVCVRALLMLAATLRFFRVYEVSMASESFGFGFAASEGTAH